MKVVADAHKNHKPLTIEASLKGILASITISGGIYDWNENSSSLVKTKIESLVKDGAVNADVFINSKGGDVFAAREIANLLADSFTEVKVHIGALAASAATYISSKFYSTARTNSQLMIHKPSGGIHGNEDQVKSKLKLLKDATADYVAVYAAKTGKTKEDIKALLAKGDYWLTSKEALKEGFIDEIIKSPATITAEDVIELAACAAPITPEVTSKNTQNENKDTMNKELLCATLGLPKDATDAEITAKIEQLKKDAGTAETLKAEADLKAKNELTANVKTLLDTAEKDGKIKPELRANYEEMATANFENTKAIIEGMPKIELPEVNASGKKVAGKSETVKGREEWTLADYQEKAPEDFDKLSDEKQDELVNAHYSDND